MQRLFQNFSLVMSAALAIVGIVDGPAPKATASTAATEDFTGLVDIGGRSLYVECRGQGSPTVIL
ncbi:MAG: hypothetical protein ACTHQQ_10815, partial [Solirubrobacteraceae bacterium]